MHERDPRFPPKSMTPQNISRHFTLAGRACAAIVLLGMALGCSSVSHPSGAAAHPSGANGHQCPARHRDTYGTGEANQCRHCSSASHQSKAAHGCKANHPNRMRKGNMMSAKPNKTIVVEGLGRLPQFAHATVAGDLIFVSGTLGTVGAGFELAPGGTGPQTTQTLQNIEKILRAAGAELSDIVKVSVYLTDMSTFQEMNEAYGEFFGETPPARITVGGAVLALGAAVEIECIARHIP